MKREAEIEVMHLQTKGHQGLLATTRTEEWQDTTQEPLKATTTAYTLISDYWSPELCNYQFLFY